MPGLSLIKGNIELDIEPDTTITRERQSPFFQIDKIPGEISFPFNLKPSDKNLKELGYIDHLPAEKAQIHDIIVKDSGQQITGGKLTTEFIQTNLRRDNVGVISAFTLSNSSEFQQRIKNKKLKDLQLGGQRNFAWDGYNATSGVGFWKHCHDTWHYSNCDDGDYVFFPVKNESYLGFATWMNKLKVVGNTVELSETGNSRSLCPSIFIAYVLQQIFEELGYSLTGDILDDPQFKRATMTSFYGVFWCTYEFDEADPPNETVSPLSNITINLQEHVPPEWTVAKFLLELQSKIPIGFDIDDNKKECRIVTLNKITTSTAKDRTEEVAASLKIVLEKEQQFHGFDNTFDNNDAYPDSFDLRSWTYMGESSTVPTATQPGEICLMVKTNEYWGIPTDQPFVPGVTVARKIVDNIYGYKPANASNTITSAMAPLPSKLMTVAQDGTWTLNERTPICKQEGNWKGKEGDFIPWDVRLLFYLGMKTAVGTIVDFPVACHHNFFQEVQDGNWSWAYKVGTYGLYDFFWYDWLKTFAHIESIEGIWEPELLDYLKHRWDEPLLLKNTPYLITNITEVLPMNGVVKVAFKGKRMGRTDKLPVSTGGGSTTFIYLQILWENLTAAVNTITAFGVTYYNNAVLGNLVVRAWADAGATTPVSPSLLPFNAEWTYSVDGVPVGTWYSYFGPSNVANAHRTNISNLTAYPVNTENSNVKIGDSTGAIMPAGVIEFSYRLVAGPGYLII
jgi:hypothetical protein